MYLGHTIVIILTSSSVLIGVSSR